MPEMQDVLDRLARIENKLGMSMPDAERSKIAQSFYGYASLSWHDRLAIIDRILAAGYKITK